MNVCCNFRGENILKKYEVSVIIPLHKTALHIFKRCFQSVREQTLGFENIELIVVVHNSPEDYEQQILSMLGGFENVKVETLHDNNFHSPSTPRNRGLDLATAEYIGLLDSDDMYTPECLKAALQHIKSTGTDICVFRREVEFESEASLILNDIVLWDQTREEIVVNKDTWDEKKIFSGQWAMATQKLYSASFIREHNLRFDPDIAFAEDAEFSAHAYGQAKNICLLPHLIGYIYYINSSSAVQSQDKSDAQLLRYAQGLKKVADAVLHYGFYPDDTLAHLLMFEAGMILKKGNVAEDVRKKIFEIMTPYAKIAKPLEPSKLYSQRELDDMNNLRKFFLSDEDAASFSNDGFLFFDERTVPETLQELQVRTLYKVLENGGKSDYGIRYNFSDIVTIDGYCSRLPLMNYDTYQPMVNLSAKINEPDIFTDEEITAYTMSYGRTGVPKRLPVTRKHLAPYMREMGRMLGGKKVFFMAKSMFYRSPVLNLDRKYTSTLTGLLLSEFYNENVHVSLSRKRAEITTPAELLFPDEIMDLEYPRLFFALREKDITTIYAPNACIFLNSIQRIAKDWEKLCDDIESGRISELKKFPDDKREKLNSRIAPDPERAKELRKIFGRAKDGNILPLVKDIWPSLVEVIADGTGSYAIYADIIRDNMRHVKLSNDFLASEEAFIGRAVPGTDMYELDLSGYSGLYRYCTNILVKCEKITDHSVTVSRLCPRDYDVQAMEGITEERAYNAVKLFVRKTGIQAADYVFIYDDEEECYRLVLEPADLGDNFAKAEWMSQALRDEAAGECAKILGTNRPVKIMFNEPGTHALYSETIQYRRKILQDAVKPCHIIDNALEGRFLTRLVV